MDFLDKPVFASVNRAKFAGFLGLEKIFQSRKDEISYEQQLKLRFPFSELCGYQSEIVAQIREESVRLYDQMITVKNPQEAENLKIKMGILNTFLASAMHYKDTVSCPVNADLIVTTTTQPGDPVINSMPVGGAQEIKAQPVQAVKPPIIPGVDNKILGYVAGGIILLAFFKIIKS